MTLARLLAGAGELSKAGLLCEICERDPKRKRYLGCLEAPVVGYRDNEGADVTIEWSPAWSSREAARLEMIDDDEFARGFYRFADVGEAKAITGEFWDCCPRSYAEFAGKKTPHLVALGNIAAQAAGDIRRGMPAHMILGGATPTLALKGLIRLAIDAQNAIERAITERDIEAQRAKAKQGRRR